MSHGQSRKPASRKPAARKAAPTKARRSRASAEPEIKASRGPGKTGPTRRTVAKPKAPQSKSPQRRSLDRAAATRRQSLNSLNADYSRNSRGRSRNSGPSGGSSVRAVAVGAGGAAAGAVRIASEVARPATRPMLRVISGGIDKLPTGSAAQPFARGRIMIMIAAVLGAGLIYINVGKLQAGDGYGKYAARSAELQRENTALRAKVADLSSVERIQTYAKRFGMVSPLPEQYKYIRTKRGDALSGARGYTAPTAPGASPTAAPDQQASGTAPTNETPVSGIDPQATTSPTQTPAPATPVQQPPVAGTQGAAGTDTGATVVGGAQ